MGCAGIVSVIVRFVSHIPTAMIGSAVLNTYQKSSKLGDILDVIPHGHELVEGLKIVGILGWVVFAYNFVMFGVSAFASGVGLAIIGVIDLALSSALVAGLVKQTMFLPREYGPCSHAADWKNATDGRNFFVVANASDSFNGFGSPKDICKSMVRDWALALSITTLYVLCGVMNVLFGICFSESRSYRQHNCDIWDILLLPLVPIYGPLRWLYKRSKPVARFAVGYVTKMLSRASYDTSVPSKKIKTKGSFGALSEKLMPMDVDFLPPKVVKLILQQLHHVDLVNMSMASKQLWARAFGYDDPQGCLDDFRELCCEGTDKAQCRLCNTQVCNGCRHVVAVPNATSYSHLSGCAAWCSSCYFEVICKKPGAEGSWRKHRTYCAQSPPKSATRFPSHTNARREEQVLCRACAKKPVEVIGAKLEEEGRYEIKRLAKHPLSCGRCTRVLEAKGPRWWICSICNIECPSNVHPPWAIGQKG